MNHIEDLPNRHETKPRKEEEGKEENLEEEQQKEEERRQVEKLSDLASEKLSAIPEKLIKHKKALEAKNSGDRDYDEKSILSDNEAESFLKIISENLGEIKKMLANLLSGEMLKRVYKALAFDVLEGRSKGDANDYLWFIDLINWKDAENKKEFVKSVSDFIGSREAGYKKYPPSTMRSLELAADLSSGKD